MARPLHIEFPGAFRHVMARGNARQAIFRTTQDREEFLNALKRVCARFDLRVWAYCLMDSHYHLLVETVEPTLSRGMREINGINTRLSTAGTRGPGTCSRAYTSRCSWTKRKSPASNGCGRVLLASSVKPAPVTKPSGWLMQAAITHLNR